MYHNHTSYVRAVLQCIVTRTFCITSQSSLLHSYTHFDRFVNNCHELPLIGTKILNLSHSKRILDNIFQHFEQNKLKNSGLFNTVALVVDETFFSKPPHLRNVTTLLNTKNAYINGRQGLLSPQWILMVMRVQDTSLKKITL